MKRRIWVGVNGNKRETFLYSSTPTFESHGDRYAAVIGPFRTIAGALVMAKFGAGNPHIQTIADAERIAAQGKKARHNPSGREIREGDIVVDLDGIKYRVYNVSVGWITAIPVNGSISDKIKFPVGDLKRVR